MRPATAVLVAGALVAACSSADEPRNDPPTAKTSTAIFAGTNATRSEVGFLNVERGVAGTLQPGAVLIAPTLVATTIFSVAKGYSYGTGVSFDSSGAVCATTGGVVDPSEVTFTLGDNTTNPADFLKGNRGTSRAVKRIITNGEIDSCKGGLAFLVLDQPIEGVTFPQIELDHAPLQNDAVTACGWGQLDAKCTFPKTLQCATGAVIIGGADGGYYAADQDNFPSGVILTTINTCGDRGGPLYDANGALVAILDRYVNADKSKVPSLASPCADCDGAVSNAYLLSGYSALVARAFNAVGSSPYRVGHAKPASVGQTCGDNLDCNSQLCVGVGATSACSQDCSSTTCPASSTCTAVGASKVCLPEVHPDPAGCAASVGRPTTGPSMLAWGLGFGICLIAARTARRASRNRRAK